ncbi:MAG TPA: competence protein ComEA [Gammaproteobacteria bacterium]|uniref:ComEA family DNA-binding protein n=1 Tax=Immundisolibacter sp. TaxID=1934948 RepID=UPI000E932AC5|nr:competence protein ComEA [Gammaproteobacteria bacterium]HCZ48259.1 competence protein ComEA [Gammaproteobacteria bacterium]MCH77697.1 competence protein ComEA [Gammaproteobacteria bacterium]
MKKSLTISLLLTLGLSAGIATAAPVDINCADAGTLTALNGIGEAKAQAIVAYRAEHGPFAGADDLANVKGIGAKIVEANRTDITASDTCSTPTD